MKSLSESTPNSSHNFKSLLQGLRLAPQTTLELEEFTSLPDKAQVYALLAVLIEDWWETLNQNNELNFGEIEQIKAPKAFLRTPLFKAEHQFQVATDQWLQTQFGGGGGSVMEAAIERAETLRTPQDQMAPSPRALLRKRLHQGINTALESTFKLPVLVEDVLKANKVTVSDEEFKAIVERSKSVLSFLATQHLAIFSFLRAQSEMGDPGDLSGNRELEGFNPAFFRLYKGREGLAITILNPGKKQTGPEPTFGKIKKTIIEKDRGRGLHTKPIGCPAIYSGIIPALSEKVVAHYLNCKHKPSRPDFATWMLQQGL